MRGVIDFFVEGNPQAQPRHRAASVGGKARMYLPSGHPVHAWKERVKLAAKQSVSSWPAAAKGVPIKVYIAFDMRRPMAHYGTGRNAGRLKDAWVAVAHTSKPDIDNLAKAVLDACNGILWHDDSQIVSLVVSKRYVIADNRKARARITVEAA